MLRRTLGSLIDAAWLRRQLTLDADIVHDAGHGLRLLGNSPGFTAVALLVLASGIGTSATIATVADALLFRPLAIPDAERVMTLWERDRATGVGREDVAPGNAIDWVTKTTSFSAAAAIEPWSLDFTPPGGEPEVLQAARVSGRFFDVLGMPLLIGRPFLAEEFTKGNDRVVILSNALYRERFGADPSVVGRSLPLDHQPYTIVGVMPRGIELRLFEARREPHVYLTKYFENYEGRIRGSGYWNVLARLKPDVTIAHARQELDMLSARLAHDYPTTNANIAGEVVPIREHLAGSVGRLLPLLLIAAALVLAVSCANAANLLLARGLLRGREFAVRQALGAGRGRLVRQMLAESLLLSMAGGALGLMLAYWGLQAITAIGPLDVAGTDRMIVDGRAAAIALALSLLAATAAGLSPALQLSRPSSAAALRESASPPAARRVRSALVVVEVCLALLLATGAGLVVRSLRAIERVDPGFAKANVFALQVFAWDRNETPAKRALFFQQTLERLRGVPGVAAAGAVSAMPFIEANINIRSPLVIEGRPAAAPGGDPSIYQTVVAGDYFNAMGVPLERGRLPLPSDRADTEPVALVNRAAARKFWPAADPIDAKVRVRFAGQPLACRIVGIVGDTRHDALDRPSRPELFLVHQQVPFGSMTFVVRAQPGAPLTMQTLKQQVWSVDPAQAFYRTATVEALVSRTLVDRRFLVFLLSAFGVGAVLLAAIGLYGVSSFSTTQRSREFGVRIALGARPADIVSIVMWEALRLSLAGIVIGVIAAVWFTRLLSGLLFGVSPADPATYASIAAGIVVVSAASCYLPARRALRADPLVTLKQP